MIAKDLAQTKSLRQIVYPLDYSFHTNEPEHSRSPYNDQVAVDLPVQRNVLVILSVPIFIVAVMYGVIISGK